MTEKRIQEATKELKKRIRANGNIWVRITLNTTGEKVSIVREGNTAFEKLEDDTFTLKFENGNETVKTLRAAAARILEIA